MFVLLAWLFPWAIRAMAVNQLSVMAIHAVSGTPLWVATEIRPDSKLLTFVPRAEQDRLLGRLSLARGDYQAAVDTLTHGLRTEPLNQLMLAYLGEAHANLGELESALEAWQRAGSFSHLLLRGNQAAQAGQWEEAIQFMEAAWALSPADYRVVSSMVRVYEAQGDNQQAVTVLRRAFATQPELKDTFNLLWLGRLLEDSGNWREAESVYRGIIEAAPREPRAHVGLARALYWGGHPLDEALAELNYAVALDPTNVEAYMSRGKIYRAEGRYGEALDSYRRAAALSPNDYWPISGQASVLIDMGNTEDAIGLLTEASDQFPDHPHLYYLLAYAYRRAGELELAAAAAERAMALGISSEELRLMLARMYEAAGRTEDALREYQAVLEINPDQKEALEGVSRLQGTN